MQYFVLAMGTEERATRIASRRNTTTLVSLITRRFQDGFLTVCIARYATSTALPNVRAQPLADDIQERHELGQPP